MIVLWFLGCAGDSPAPLVTLSALPGTVLGVGARVETEPGCRAAVGVVGDGFQERFTRWSGEDEVHDLEVLGLRADAEWTLTAWADCEGVWTPSTPVDWSTGSLALSVPSMDLVVTDPEAVSPGVTFLAPVVRGSGEPPVFLGLDEEGEVVWATQDPEGDTAHADPFLALQDDGTVLVVQHDAVQGLTWSGERIWEVRGVDAGLDGLHHDALLLPDGTILGLVPETREVAIEGEASQVLGDRIVQLSQDSELLWSWSPFDHLDTTGLTLDDAQDWLHANALVYRDGLILLSSRAQDRLIALDHGSGEVQWQLGRGGDFDLLAGGWFDGQHAPEWHEDGTLVLYDNDLGGRRSRGVVYTLDEDARTLEQRWDWEAEAYTPRLGDADLLEGGSLLVTAGGPEARDAPAVISEVSPGEGVVWELTVHGAAVYRATRVDWPWLRPFP